MSPRPAQLPPRWTAPLLVVAADQGKTLVAAGRIEAGVVTRPAYTHPARRAVSPEDPVVSALDPRGPFSPAEVARSAIPTWPTTVRLCSACKTSYAASWSAAIHR